MIVRLVGLLIVAALTIPAHAAQSAVPKAADPTHGLTQQDRWDSLAHIMLAAQPSGAIA